MNKPLAHPVDPAPQDDEADRAARYDALVQEGLDDIKAGRLEAVDDIEAWLDQLMPSPKAYRGVTSRL